jgi:hypothetical protein
MLSSKYKKMIKNLTEKSISTKGEKRTVHNFVKILTPQTALYALLLLMVN